MMDSSIADLTPAFAVFGAWLLFCLSHLYMSGSKLRERWATRYTPKQFTAIFSGVTVVTMLVLIATISEFGDQGAAGPDLGRFPWLLWPLLAIAAGGGLLATAGLMSYPKSPMAVLAQRQRQGLESNHSLNPPSAVEQVSRHPFFAGLALVMLTHGLLASTLASALYFFGFVVICVVGIPLQDRKLRQRWRETYSAFEQSTSALPFGTQLGSGTPARANLATTTPAQSQWKFWALAMLVALLVLGLGHSLWMLGNGAAFAAFILLFGLAGVLRALIQT